MTMTRIFLDYNALKSLIGNDTQVEVDLRQAIVNTFSKKHLKSVANQMADGFGMKLANEVVSAVIDNMKTNIHTAILKQCDSNGNVRSYSDIDRVVRSVVDKLITQRLNTEDITKYIDKAIEAQFTKVVNERVINKIKTILDSTDET